MSFPTEIWLDIFEFLDIREEYPSLSLTCKTFYSIAQEDSLWEKHCDEVYSPFLRFKDKFQDHVKRSKQAKEEVGVFMERLKQHKGHPKILSVFSQRKDILEKRGITSMGIPSDEFVTIEIYKAKPYTLICNNHRVEITEKQISDFVYFLCYFSEKWHPYIGTFYPIAHKIIKGKREITMEKLLYYRSSVSSMDKKIRKWKHCENIWVKEVFEDDQCIKIVLLEDGHVSEIFRKYEKEWENF